MEKREQLPDFPEGGGTMKAYKSLGIPKWALKSKGKSPGTKGGQHANRNYTAVELRLDIRCFEGVDPETLGRLRRIAGSRISKAGILTIEENGSRSQKKNFQEAVDRLAGLLEKARTKPKKRIPTKPTRASRLRKKTAQQRHSRKKEDRRRVDY